MEDFHCVGEFMAWKYSFSTIHQPSGSDQGWTSFSQSKQLKPSVNYFPLVQRRIVWPLLSILPEATWHNKFPCSSLLKDIIIKQHLLPRKVFWSVIKYQLSGLKESKLKGSQSNNSSENKNLNDKNNNFHNYSVTIEMDPTKFNPFHERGLQHFGHVRIQLAVVQRRRRGFLVIFPHLLCHVLYVLSTWEHSQTFPQYK